MTDIVYWGNGEETLGEYTAPKDVESAGIQQIQIGTQIIWSAGDTERIQGQVISIQSIPTASSCEGDVGIVQRNYYPNGGTWTATFPSPFGSGSGTIGEDSIGWLVDFGDCLGARWRAVYSKRPSVCGGYCYTFQSSTGGILLSGSNPVQVVKYTGGKSWRQQNSPPTISPIEGCAIAVTYTDNSTYQIPLNTCPEWVRVRTDIFPCPNACTIADRIIALYGM